MSSLNETLIGIIAENLGQEYQRPREFSLMASNWHTMTWPCLCFATLYVETGVSSIPSISSISSRVTCSNSSSLNSKLQSSISLS